MAILRIISVRCNRQEDWTGDDDIYVTLNGVKVQLGAYDDGQTREINKDKAFVSRVEMRFYEYDAADSDDYLGAHSVTRDAVGQGEQIVNFSAYGASYDVFYIVIPDTQQ
jgi:hypothetical protein